MTPRYRNFDVYSLQQFLFFTEIKCVRDSLSLDGGSEIKTCWLCVPIVDFQPFLFVTYNRCVRVFFFPHIFFLTRDKSILESSCINDFDLIERV